MTDDFTDRLDQLADMTKRLIALSEETRELSAVRRELARELCNDGYSHSQLAWAVGVSRGRIFQIVRETKRRSRP